MSKFVITGDWHLRDDLPVCRNDSDWFGVQKDAVHFVFTYAKKIGANVAIDGDICHRSHIHPSLITMFLQEAAEFGGNIFIIPGQHDLPYHSMEYVDRSSFGNLRAAMAMRESNIMDAGDRGLTIPFGKLEERVYEDNTEFLFLHQLTFASPADMPPTDEGVLADDLLDRFPNISYICLGDNHRHFVVQRGDRYVINPGCLLRQSADLIDYEPGFYVLDTAGRGKVEFVKVPDAGKVSNEHITKEKERDDRIEAFVASLEKGQEMSLDFVHNLREKMPTLSQGTRDVLEEMIEEIGAIK